MAKKKTRNIRGLGSLYKRCSNGKDYPPTSKKAGVLWLKYFENGKRVRIPLEVDGKPVTDLETAQAEQLRLRAPYLTGDKIEALKKIKADLVDLEEKQVVEQDKAEPPMKLADVWQSYLDATNRPDTGPATLENYHRHWKAFSAWLEKQAKAYVYLREITEADAGAFMAQLRNSAKSANTYNKYLQFLRMFCRVLFKPARLTINPFEDIQRRPQQPKSRRELTIAELKKTIYTATGDLRLLLQVGTFTGLRLGDACTLQWGEIDLERQIIKRVLRKTASRSHKAITIGIPSLLLHELQQIPEVQRVGYLLPRFAELYQGPHGTGNVTRIIQTHFHKCGIETHVAGTGTKFHYEGKKKVYDSKPRAIVLVGFHSFRHTWVSLHAMSGTPQAVIQDAAGHSNPAMTAHYTHTSEDAARRVASALDLPQLAEAIDVKPIPSEESPEEIQKKKLHNLIDRLPFNAAQTLLDYIGKAFHQDENSELRPCNDK